MGSDGGYDFCIHIQDAAGFQFLLRKLHDLVPKLGGVLGRPFQESVIAVIGGIVFLYKIADINFPLPYTAVKSVPFCSQRLFLLWNACADSIIVELLLAI